MLTTLQSTPEDDIEAVCRGCGHHGYRAEKTLVFGHRALRTEGDVVAHLRQTHDAIKLQRAVFGTHNTFNHFCLRGVRLRGLFIGCRCVTKIDAKFDANLEANFNANFDAKFDANFGAKAGPTRSEKKKLREKLKFLGPKAPKIFSRSPSQKKGLKKFWAR